MIISSSYPTHLNVGEWPIQGHYSLQADQILLKFTQSMDDQQIQSLLQETNLQPVDRGPELPNRGYLPRDMLWVNVKQQPASMSQYAQELLQKYQDQLIMVSPVYYAQGKGPKSAAVPMPQCLIVRFKQGAKKKGKRVLARKFGLKYDKCGSRWLGRFHKFWIPSSTKSFTPQYNGEPSDTIKILNSVSQVTEVDFVELNWLTLEAFAAPHCDQLWDDPGVDWGGQWNMKQIHMEEAWEEQSGDDSMVIAVIDTGFDTAHPDLHFTPESSFFNAYAAQELHEDPPYDASPDLDGTGSPGHGTAVAGIVAASCNSEEGVAGVAKGSTIMPIRCSSGGSLWSDGFTASLQWAIEHDAQIVNMSFQGIHVAQCSAAIVEAWDAGVILCASTGNYDADSDEDEIDYPAKHPYVLSVGASDDLDQRVLLTTSGEGWGSRYASMAGTEPRNMMLDVVAPGIHLWSTDIHGSDGYGSDDYYSRMNGTSGACPHVAGLAALLLLKYPGIDKQQVRNAIERSCDKVGGYDYDLVEGRPNGTWYEEVGHGRINCLAALRYADIVIADHDQDVGDEPSSSLRDGVWSPQIFWEYQPYVTNNSQPDALPSEHQSVVPGSDIHVHAIVRNRGPAIARNIQVTWHAMDFPGTEFWWPENWNDDNEIASYTIDRLGVDEEIRVQAPWPEELVNVASDYVHPCLLVQARTVQDPDGSLECHVWQYNNIAQHNISFASTKRSAAPKRKFTLPFAIGHHLSQAHWARLYFDLRAAKGAIVLVDFNPDNSLPYIENIRKVIERYPPRMYVQHDCGAKTLEDTRFELNCCGCRAEVMLKAGSTLRLLCQHQPQVIDLSTLKLHNAIPVSYDGRSQLQLKGPVASISMPLLQGQILPVAMTVILPHGARSGTHYRVDVSQESDGQGTGGVSLDVLQH